MTKAIAVLVVVVLALAATLGFHWISYPGTHGSVYCVLPKSQLSFSDTVVSDNSQLVFAVKHPLFAAQIVSGHGWCSDR